MSRPHTLGGNTPFSARMVVPHHQIGRLKTFGARYFVHEERHAKKITMKLWERRIVGHGNIIPRRIGFGNRGTAPSSLVPWLSAVPVKLTAIIPIEND